MHIPVGDGEAARFELGKPAEEIDHMEAPLPGRPLHLLEKIGIGIVLPRLFPGPRPYSEHHRDIHTGGGRRYIVESPFHTLPFFRMPVKIAEIIAPPDTVQIPVPFRFRQQAEEVGTFPPQRLPEVIGEGLHRFDFGIVQIVANQNQSRVKGEDLVFQQERLIASRISPHSEIEHFETGLRLTNGSIEQLLQNGRKALIIAYAIPVGNGVPEYGETANGTLPVRNHFPVSHSVTVGGVRSAVELDASIRSQFIDKPRDRGGLMDRTLPPLCRYVTAGISEADRAENPERDLPERKYNQQGNEKRGRTLQITLHPDLPPACPSDQFHSERSPDHPAVVQGAFLHYNISPAPGASRPGRPAGIPISQSDNLWTIARG